MKRIFPNWLFFKGGVHQCFGSPGEELALRLLQGPDRGDRWLMLSPAYPA